MIDTVFDHRFEKPQANYAIYPFIINDLTASYKAGRALVVDDIFDTGTLAALLRQKLAIMSGYSNGNSHLLPITVPATKDIPQEHRVLHQYATIYKAPANIHFANNWVLSSLGLDGGSIKAEKIMEFKPSMTLEAAQNLEAKISALERLCKVAIIKRTPDANFTSFEEVEGYLRVLIANCSVRNSQDEISEDEIYENELFLDSYHLDHPKSKKDMAATVAELFGTKDKRGIVIES